MTWRDWLDLRIWLAAAGMAVFMGIMWALLAIAEQAIHG